jgi:hypothetical protein
MFSDMEAQCYRLLVYTIMSLIVFPMESHDVVFKTIATHRGGTPQANDNTAAAALASCDQGQSLLHVAARAGQAQVLELLLHHPVVMASSLVHVCTFDRYDEQMNYLDI